MIDAVGRRVCSGATFRLPFGSVGTLVAKEGKLDFAFGEAFGYPKLQPKEVIQHCHCLAHLDTLTASLPCFPFPERAERAERAKGRILSYDPVDIGRLASTPGKRRIQKLIRMRADMACLRPKKARTLWILLVILFCLSQSGPLKM